MDKGRHPHVVRTWTVERTRLPHRSSQPVKPPANPRQEIFRGPQKIQHGPPAPKTGDQQE